jgi:hypothetical protein
MNARKFLVGASAILIAIIFSLLLLELSLQIFFYVKNGHPLWNGHKNFTVGYVAPTEDRRQYALKPGYSDQQIKINQQGFRGEIIGNNQQLICVIGDSVPFGSGVSNGETFPDFLDKNPATQLKGLHVLNAGVPSYNLAQSFDAWRMELRSRKCNFLIVNAANDISLLDFYQSDWSLDKTWASARFNINKKNYGAVFHYVDKIFLRKAKANSITVERNIDLILKRLESDIADVVSLGIKVVLMPIQPCYYNSLPYNSSHSKSACAGYSEYEKLANGWDPLIAKVNSGLLAMSNNQTVLFFDSTSVLETGNIKDNAFVDFIHYSVSGNKLIADRLASFIFDN